MSRQTPPYDSAPRPCIRENSPDHPHPLRPSAPQQDPGAPSLSPRARAQQFMLLTLLSLFMALTCWPSPASHKKPNTPTDTSSSRMNKYLKENLWHWWVPGLRRDSRKKSSRHSAARPSRVTLSWNSHPEHHPQFLEPEVTANPRPLSSTLRPHERGGWEQNRGRKGLQAAEGVGNRRRGEGDGGVHFVLGHAGPVSFDVSGGSRRENPFCIEVGAISTNCSAQTGTLGSSG